MYLIIVACVLFTVANAGVVPADAQAEILDYQNINDGFGNYRFSFGTSNGITRQENGRLANPGEQNEHIVVEGTYSYTDPEGKVVVVQYVADDNGYQILDSKPSLPALGVPANVVASLLGK